MAQRASELIPDREHLARHCYGWHNKGYIFTHPDEVNLDNCASMCLVTAVYIAQNCDSLREAQKKTLNAIRVLEPGYIGTAETYNNTRPFEDIQKVLEVIDAKTC